MCFFPSCWGAHRPMGAHPTIQPFEVGSSTVPQFCKGKLAFLHRQRLSRSSGSEFFPQGWRASRSRKPAFCCPRFCEWNTKICGSNMASAWFVQPSRVSLLNPLQLLTIRLLHSCQSYIPIYILVFLILFCLLQNSTCKSYGFQLVEPLEFPFPDVLHDWASSVQSPCGYINDMAPQDGRSQNLHLKFSRLNIYMF